MPQVCNGNLTDVPRKKNGMKVNTIIWRSPHSTPIHKPRQFQHSSWKDVFHNRRLTMTLHQQARYLAVAHFLWAGFHLILVGIAMCGALLLVIAYGIGAAVLSWLWSVLYTIRLFAAIQEWLSEIQWLTAIIIFIWRCGPIITGLVSILVTLVVGVAVTSPFFATGYALVKNKPWLTPVSLVAVILSVPLFPFGTLLAAWTIVYWVLRFKDTRQTA